MQITIRPYQNEDRRDTIALWHDCHLVVPQNDPHEDILRKIRFQPEFFLVGLDEGHLIATVMAGYEGHRGWINYLAVSPRHRRKGLGRQMLAAAEERLRSLGCPKINLQVRRTNTAVINFYRNAGFDEDEVVSLGKRLD
ncbi:MAG: GNAT family acetyltransferase [Desulfosarcina sp.]|nr:GNAT family acetyltransferase [Desulfobacterales bacterium]